METLVETYMTFSGDIWWREGYSETEGVKSAAAYYRIWGGVGGRRPCEEARSLSHEEQLVDGRRRARV